MRDANEKIDILWNGQMVIGAMIEQCGSRMRPEHLEALDAFMQLVNEIRIEKARRVSARMRARAKKRAATRHYSLAD